MKDELYTEKITVYISENQAQRIKNLPRNFNLSGRMREALEEVLFKEGWDCIKRILRNNEENDRAFFKITSQGEILTKIAVITLLSPNERNHCLSIPATEGYGIKLTLKDANGNEIPDDAIIELRKEKMGNSKLLGEYEYKELKREVKSLRNQTYLHVGEELVIYVEPKHAGIINPEVRFAVDFCTMKQ
ncbi:MAG: hypothetical protein WCE94_02985 [Candidatus Methanoperedens sp.]